MKFLLNKEIYGINSTKMQVFSIDGSIKEIIVAYRSEMRLFEQNKNSEAQLVNIVSKWEEYSDYSDNLEISFEYGEIMRLNAAALLQRHGLSSTLSYRTNSSNNKFFKIKKIDLFGYNIDFNSHKPTRHIVLFSSYGDEQILMYPMMSGIGLKILVKKCFIENFFENSQGHELIYLANTYTIDNV